MNAVRPWHWPTTGSPSRRRTERRHGQLAPVRTLPIAFISSMDPPDPRTHDDRLRRVVRRVALLNLGYFGIEISVAVAIGSVSLFADSIDFLEDASINLLILLGIGW